MRRGSLVLFTGSTKDIFLQVYIEIVAFVELCNSSQPFGDQV